MPDEPSPPAGCWITHLVELHQSALIRYARTLVHDADAARDIVQEAFLRLCREPRERVEGHAVPWLFHVCHNLASNRLRKERRMHADSELVARHTTDADPTNPVQVNDQYLHVMRWVDELPENQQKVVRLRFAAGLSYREMSAATGLSESNVGYLLHTALMQLRRHCQSPHSPSLSTNR